MANEMTDKQKQEYNTFLENLNKAIAWMDNPKVSLKKKEEFAPRVIQLMGDMDVLAKKYKLTEEEMLNGV